MCERVLTYAWNEANLRAAKYESQYRLWGLGTLLYLISHGARHDSHRIWAVMSDGEQSNKRTSEFHRYSVVQIIHRIANMLHHKPELHTEYYASAVSGAA